MGYYGMCKQKYGVYYKCRIVLFVLIVVGIVLVCGLFGMILGGFCLIDVNDLLVQEMVQFVVSIYVFRINVVNDGFIFVDYVWFQV